MKKQTRSLLEELESLHVEKDATYVIGTRATNVIESAIRLLDLVEKTYDTSEAENLTRKLLNAIKQKDASKFQRSLKRANENKRNNTD